MQDLGRGDCTPPKCRSLGAVLTDCGSLRPSAPSSLEHRECRLPVEFPAADSSQPDAYYTSSKACFVADGGEGDVFFAETDIIIDKMHSAAYTSRPDLAVQSRLPADWAPWLSTSPEDVLQLYKYNYSVYVLAPGLRQRVLPACLPQHSRCHSHAGCITLVHPCPHARMHAYLYKPGSLQACARACIASCRASGQVQPRQTAAP